MSEHFDVAVIGAGPAGSAAARRLALSGCRVALVERTRFEEPRVGESLPPAVQPLLVELGVWRDFMQLDPLASHGTRSVWGQPAPEVHSHMGSAWGCGWHVDRLAFDRMLAACAEQAGAMLFCGTSFKGCVDEGDAWLLRLSGGLALRVRVVIDATGRAARVATGLAAQRLLLDRLVGIAMQFDCVDTAREGYVQVETSGDGWWYTAPVPHGRMMAMIMTDSDLCGRERLASEPEWAARLTTAPATRERLSSANVLWGPRVFFAASQRLRRRDVARRWIAVGDAALAVDPISGSGVIRALRSAKAGAETVLAMLEGQTAEAIGAYEAGRDAECTEYLQERAMYYGIEHRWSESMFWKRRTFA
jgi:flavin-dependent dehydrogenase